MGEIVLSIGIASYNRKEWVCKNIDNLLEYKRDDIEIIVCDNASCDGTWEELQRYNDKRLKVIRNEKNCGARYNWLKSLVLGVGKYGIAINDRDTLNVDLLYGFIEMLKYNTSDVVVACSILRKYRNKFDRIAIRACSLNRNNHPGTYYISRSVINQLKCKIDTNLEYMEKVELDRYMLKVTFEWQQILLHTNKWKWYEKTIIKGTNRGKVGLKQTREENMPWFYPQTSISKITNWVLFCNDDDDIEDILCGVYRAGLQTCLQVFYTRDPQKRSWEKIVMKFYKDSIDKLIELNRFTFKIGRGVSTITLSECYAFEIERLWTKIVSIKMKFIPQPIFKRKS